LNIGALPPSKISQIYSHLPFNLNIDVYSLTLLKPIGNKFLFE
jgi:hypothetical protein